MSEARYRAGGLLGHALVGGLFATVRFRAEDEENFLRFRRERTPVIFVIWHGHLLPLVYRHRHTGVVALVSEHADGEYITRIIQRIGFETARGSSTRGGIQGLKGLIRAAREGHDLALTVDGPRGPRHRVKPGALLAAQTTGLPIVPVAAGASRAWRFDSWDRFMLPKPFATVRIAYGRPQWIERGADREALAAASATLERELMDLTVRCGGDPEERLAGEPG